MKHYDAAIIGFGKGGKTLAGTLAAAGQSVAVIEQSPRMYGGTCINVACIPTKTLVHAAALSQAQGGTFAERAARYAAAIDEKDRVTGMLRAKNYHKIADLPNVDVIDGRASFVDATHLAIEMAVAEGAASAETAPQQIEADRIFVNTGARPFRAPIPGIDSPRVFVSEALLDLRTLPERFVIIGGGYIGLEFASMYANFGSQVTVVQDTEQFHPPRRRRHRNRRAGKPRAARDSHRAQRPRRAHRPRSRAGRRGGRGRRRRRAHPGRCGARGDGSSPERGGARA